MDRITSQPLQDLLDDEIFADFFNTFLNLPVFGQTPYYIPVLRQWELWPPLPSNKTPFYRGFISWLQQHRLQLFSRSDLCMHYLLCQQLLENLQAEKLSKEPENVHIDTQEREDGIQTECENTSVTSAVLRSCIGSVCGILRFRKFLCGTTGGELTSFWLITAKILGLNEHNKVEKDLCHSLYRILKATHLSPGSGVLETCSITSASMLQLMSCHPLKSRRDVLKQMQTEAFWKLKHYWIPAYVSHCQVCLFKLPNELALPEVHQQTGLQKEKLHDNPEPSTQLQKETSEKYSSKVNTKQKWYRMTSGIDAMYPESSRRNVMKPIYPEKSSCVHLPDHRQSHITPKEPNTIVTDSKQQISVTNPHSEFLFSTLPHTPVIDLFPPRELESTKLSPDWLHWALKAEAYTGYPFHSFLTAAGKHGAAQLINLWQDLADLHKALIFDENLDLCFLLTEQFFLHCSLEIEEDSNTCSSIQPNGLGTHIAQHTMTQLKELLPCREAVPWILQAQHELSQSLSSVYEEFLDEDEKMFLQFVTCSVSDAIPTKPSSVPIEDKGEHIIHRFRRALRLAEACSPGGDFRELDLEGFNLLQTEDLSQGGADEPFIPIPPVHMKVNYNDMSFEDFEDLPLWNPKMAVEILSKQFQVYSKDGTAVLTSQSSLQQYRRHVYRSVYWNKEGKLCIRKGKVLLYKPTVRPRTLYEVLYDPVHLEFFRQFLRMNHAEEPLIFWLTVKKLASISNLKQEQAYIEIILQRFFQKNPEELLQCDAVVIGEISKMGSVSTNILQSAQAFVFKSMDEKWFKKYQGTFPDVVPSPVKPRKRKSYSKPKTVKKAWYVIVSFIHSTCKFLKSMKNAAIRKEFETFLQQEVYNDSRIPTAGRYEQSRGPSSSRFKPKDPRRCFAGNHAIHINYLVNDLSFCIEVLRFYEMCDAVEALASYGMCGLNSEAILREKVNIIVKLFLDCDTPPKFRINISESQRDIILDMARCGAANRALLHSALFTVFPTIISFWKRFCTVRAMCGFCCRQTQKRKTKTDPSLTKEVQYRIRSHYAYPILRYTLSQGIQLLLPNVPEKRYKAESKDHLSPWKQNTPPTSLLLTPHSIMLEKTSLRSPSGESSVFIHKV